MSRQEILNELYGTYIDMISCLTVYNGNVKEKTKRAYTFDEAINLR